MSASTTSRGLPPPPPAGLPAKVVPIPPNQTLYVRNLPSAKIKKADLRTALYLLFSTYGPVLDVVALKTANMRGQAHIAFRDVQAATQAMRSLEGFSFFGHELKIAYAKSKSNVIARLDGSFKMPTAAQTVEVTDLQQSIFNAPIPGSAAAPPPPAAATAATNGTAAAQAQQTRGQKRTRDEDEEDEADAADKDKKDKKAAAGGDSESSDDSDVEMEEDSDDE